MARIFYDRDADLSLIRKKKVGIVGYGSQGHAHALNLRDSGVEVQVGLPETSKRFAVAQKAGLTVRAVAEVAAWCDVIMILAPDTAQPKIWREQIGPPLGPGQAAPVAPRLNHHLQALRARPGHRLAAVPAQAPGPRVRETFAEGGGVPALLAVREGSSPGAHALALSYAAGLG